MDSEIPYLLLTPGPLTTSRTVRQAMQCDYSTWDSDYNEMVGQIRKRLVGLATQQDGYTAVLMPGSGTFSVEATLGSVVPSQGRLLIVNNGAYGARMTQIATRLRIDQVEIAHTETESPDLDRVEAALNGDAAITHIAMVHCETTTGMLNPARAVGELAARFGKHFILDAMSSFGGIPLTMESLHVDYLVSSANKCIQGVPGFGFVIARRSALEQTQGWARSLSLDLYDQWREMEQHQSKWRYTSPTHAVCAFSQALDELQAEGGVTARHARYRQLQTRLVAGMQELGFKTLLPASLQSPIITSFHSPEHPNFKFSDFYDRLKSLRFVIYPGKVTNAETFRIGNIGHVFADDIDALIRSIAEVMKEMNIPLR